MPHNTDKQPIRKVMVSLPENVYKRLGYHSVETDRTMSAIVVEALHLYFDKAGKRMAPRQPRGSIADRKEHFAARP